MAAPLAAGAAVLAPCRLTVGWTPTDQQSRGSDGEPTGIAIDLMRLIAQEAGCSLVLLERGADAVIADLASGAVDVAAGLPAAQEAARDLAPGLLLSPRSVPPDLERLLAEAAGRVKADGRADLLVERYRSLAGTPDDGA